MIKLFSLKQQKKDGEGAHRGANQKKASAAQLRITKGVFFLYPPLWPGNKLTVGIFRYQRAEPAENLQHRIPGPRRFVELQTGY